jgi:hypothetical protein
MINTQYTKYYTSHDHHVTMIPAPKLVHTYIEYPQIEIGKPNSQNIHPTWLGRQLTTLGSYAQMTVAGRIALELWDGAGGELSRF